MDGNAEVYNILNDPDAIEKVLLERDSLRRQLEKLRLQLQAQIVVSQGLAESRDNKERMLEEAGIKDGTAPFYNADGTEERVPIAQWVERRKIAARCIAVFGVLAEDCREFVRKCECGEAQSRRSYTAMKGHLDALDALVWK
jgi:hypothetical protein